MPRTVLLVLPCFLALAAPNCRGEDVKPPLYGKPLRDWLAALHSQNETTRFEASQVLGLVGADAVPGLVKAMEDASPAVREAAAQGLRLAGPAAKAAVSPLIHALEDKDDEVRLLAARALGGIGPAAAEAGKPLVEFLQAEDWQRRPAAVEALALIRSKDSVAPLTSALKHQDQFVRTAAAEALAHLGPAAGDAVLSLREALQDPSDWVRIQAAVALAYVEPKRAPDAVAALFSILRDAATRDRWDAHFLRDEVAEALEALGPLAVEPLRVNLHDKDVEVRRLAAWNFRWVSSDLSRAAVTDLAAALSDPDPHVQWCAARMLRVVRDESESVAVPALVKAVGSDNPAVREEALTALRWAGPKVNAQAKDAFRAALGVKDEKVRLAAAEALADIDPSVQEAEDVLVAALKDREPSVRCSVACSLGRFGKKAVPLLVAALADEEAAVRSGAAGTLAGIGPDAAPARDALVEGLIDSEEHVRAAAALALACICPDDRVGWDRISALLRDSDLSARWHVIESLERLGPAARPVLPAIRAACADPAVRVNAAVALTRIDPDRTDEAVAVLIAALEKPSGVYEDEQAAKRLEELGPAARAAVPALTAALEREGSRYHAAPALGAMGAAARSAAPALRKAALQSPHGRAEVLLALTRVSTEDDDFAVRLFADSLRCNDGHVVGDVLYAIRQLGPRAKAATPAVLSVPGLVAYGDLSTRARNCLRAINPEAARRVGIP
jgi:HEAT repeat protein